MNKLTSAYVVGGTFLPHVFEALTQRLSLLLISRPGEVKWLIRWANLGAQSMRKANSLPRFSSWMHTCWQRSVQGGTVPGTAGDGDRFESKFSEM